MAEKIVWGQPHKEIQELEGWEWLRQDVVTVDKPLEKSEIKAFFINLQKKVNPFIHYDIFKAVKDGGSVIKIAQFPIYVPPAPKQASEYVNGHVTDTKQQKWYRPLPVLQNRLQTKMPSPHEWDKALRDLDYSYAKLQLSKDADELKSLSSWNKLVKREWDRVLNGCWFMINGKPTYICGSYYFFLTYWTNKEGTHNHYIEADSEEFLHAEAILKTRGIKGRIEFCRRQDGKSTRHFCLMYWATVATQLTSIVQGKSLNDIKDNYAEHYLPKIILLPFIFKPYTESDLQEAIGVKKSKQARGKFDDSVKVNQLEIQFQHGVGYQGGRILGLQPNAKAGDGKTLLAAYSDEFGKTELVDIVQRYDILAPAVPKIFMTTTVENINAMVMPQCRDLSESSDYPLADESIRREYDCKKLIDKIIIDWCFTETPFIEFVKKDTTYEQIFSDLQGKITIKGMVQYIKPSWYCFIDRADQISFVDSFGQSESVKAHSYLTKERIKLYNFCRSSGNMANYYSYIRKYPFTLDEALGDDSTDNLFDIAAINAQIKRVEDAVFYGRDYIEIKEYDYFLAELEGDTYTTEAKEKIEYLKTLTDSVKIPLYQKYRLEWIDGKVFGKVMAIPDKNGLHQISEFPSHSNLVSYEKGVTTGLGNREDGWTPKSTYYTGGIDSIDLPKDDLTGKSKPSDFCLIIKSSKRNPNLLNNRPVHRLKYRPNDPKEAYMEAMKALWLFGCAAGFENGKEAFKSWAKDIECIKFIALSVTIDTTQQPNRKQLFIRGNTNTGKDKEVNFINIANYMAYYVLRVTDLALLKSLRGLTYKNLTKRDDCAAFMQSETTDISPSKLSVAMGNRVQRKPLGNFKQSFLAR